MKLSDKRKNIAALQSPVSAIVNQINDLLRSQKFITSELSKLALSTEALDDSQHNNLYTNENNISTALEAMHTSLFGDNVSLEQYQIEAGTCAALFAGNIQDFFKKSVPKMLTSNENTSATPNFAVSDGFYERSFRSAMEAYDERENRQAASYSITFNMRAAQQDEFGETLFPTLVVAPDSSGFIINVQLLMVYNELQRNISGALDQYNKKNVIRAIEDPTILKNNMTKIVAVRRTESAANFVDDTLIPHYSVIFEGETVETAPLACGKSFSLLGLSQTDTLIANGNLDVTDSIDPSVSLANIYVKVPGTVGGQPANDVLKIRVDGLPYSVFTYSVQDLVRLVTLNFTTNSILVSPATKNVDSTDLGVLASIKTNGLNVRLKVIMNGSVNLELADTSVFGNLIQVHSISDADGQLIPLTTTPGQEIVASFAGATIVGYDLNAWRTSSNRRQRGQLIDRVSWNQAYVVPLRSPITALHPVTNDSSGDSLDLESLITTTRIRTSNAAVEQLITTDQILSEYIAVNDVVGTGPDVLGVGRFYVIPTYYAPDEIDVTNIVNNIQSANWKEDVQEALVTQIRQYVYEMYRHSQYQAAADALSGGKAPKPRVIIATDTVIAQYLMVTGDLRTLGNEFEYTIVSSLNRLMTDKIFITFGVFDDNRNTAPNPLNFGNMAWSSELTVVLPISRGGQTSKELTVQPRFTHMTHLPVLTKLVIKNIPGLLTKIPVRTVSV